jgi:RNA polymerase sigma factor (sigma-70 family)
LNVNQEIEEHWLLYGDSLKFKDCDVESYDMVRGYLTKYAFSRLKNWMDAEDAVQDAYIHALTYPPIGEGHNFFGLFKLYLDRSIVNIKAKNYHRSQLLQEEETTDEENQVMISLTETTEPGPDQIVDLIGQTDLIMDMSDHLKPKQKAIVRLALIFGYSHKEVAEITKANLRTIENTLAYFRQKIKENPKYEDLRG